MAFLFNKFKFPPSSVSTEEQLTDLYVQSVNGNKRDLLFRGVPEFFLNLR